MNPTAIIFDMNGVLIDSGPAHKLAKERVFAITTSFTEKLLRRKGADEVIQDFQELRVLLELGSPQSGNR